MSDAGVVATVAVAGSDTNLASHLTGVEAVAGVAAENGGRWATSWPGVEVVA